MNVERSEGQFGIDTINAPEIIGPLTYKSFLEGGGKLSPDGFKEAIEKLELLRTIIPNDRRKREVRPFPHSQDSIPTIRSIEYALYQHLRGIMPYPNMNYPDFPPAITAEPFQMCDGELKAEVCLICGDLETYRALKLADSKRVADLQ